MQPSSTVTVAPPAAGLHIRDQPLRRKNCSWFPNPHGVVHSRHDIGQGGNGERAFPFSLDLDLLICIPRDGKWEYPLVDYAVIDAQPLMRASLTPPRSRDLVANDNVIC